MPAGVPSSTSASSSPAIAVAAFDDGRIFDLTPGTIFHIPPEEHDSWVVGDLPYMSLHLLGAAAYAT